MKAELDDRVGGRAGEAARAGNDATRAAAKSSISLQVLAAAFVIFAVNLALKLPGLTAQGLWFDEAVSIQNASQPIDLARRMATDASPPLFGVLLSLWMDVFGLSLGGARSLSAVLSSATAALLFVFGRRFVSAEAGVVAAALFTTSRHQLFFAHETRPYALVGLLCVASFFAFCSLLRSGSRRAAAALAIGNAALLYAHYLAGLALVAQLVAALAIARRAPGTFRVYVVSQVATGLFFLPCALWIALHWPPPMSGWAMAPTPDRLLYVLDLFAGSRLLLALEVGLIAIAAVWGARGPAPGSGVPASAASASPGDDATRADPSGLVLLLWFAVPITLGFVVSQAVPIFLHRYLLFASLAFYLLVGRAVSLLRVGAAVRGATAAGLAIASMVALWQNPILRPDWRGAVAVTREAARPGAIAVVIPPYQLVPFAFHFSPAAFADPERMADRLAAEGVIGLPLSAALDAAPQLQTDRLVVAVSEEFGPLSPDLVPRLADAGFAVASERRFPGVAVLVFDRRP